MESWLHQDAAYGAGPYYCACSALPVPLICERYSEQQGLDGCWQLTVPVYDFFMLQLLYGPVIRPMPLPVIGVTCGLCQCEGCMCTWNDVSWYDA